MIDHIGLAVSDLERSRQFYRDALAPLGIAIVMEVTPEQTGGLAAIGFGTAGKPFFWISDHETTSGPMHVALAAEARADVDAFYAAAIRAGAKDNGPPGLRPHYHPNYYGAFVLDPDGNNLEAVCHRSE